MKRILPILSLLAVVVSFIGGFLLANALNKKELEELRRENARLKSERQSSSLSDEEIRSKIEQADKRPDDFNFQKGLGIALYRYSVIEQNPQYLPDVLRLLERAANLNPLDFETQAALGDVNLDLAQITKDNSRYERARQFYQKALQIRPKDADIQSSVALTYLLADPADYDKAIEELKKALASQPNHERSLESMVRALVAKGDKEAASEYLNRLRKINPQNPVITELENQAQ
ncbi:MAG: hypothetical protein D6735_08285 [Acidobacteria bacterium]|nr:MAG: hypothetical protein D6735_08285 [Acidobacteriota bacterium]